MNLIEGLQAEIQRNEELLSIYESIPVGVFGATLIRRDIAEAKKCIGENDIVKMIGILKRLQGNK